jgi:hypothetical protein
MVISTSLKTLYSFWYREYINHIHLPNFLLLHSSSLRSWYNWEGRGGRERVWEYSGNTVYACRKMEK